MSSEVQWQFCSESMWLAVIACACGLCILGGCNGGDPTASTPELVFEDGFLSPLADVMIEAEGGTVVGGYDAWLKLLPRGELIPRFEVDYRYIDCGEPRAFFAAVLNSDELSPTKASLTCRLYRDERLEFDSGRWLVENHVDGRYYFRAWKGF